MKRILAAINVLLLGTWIVLLNTAAVSPTTLSVQTLTNGVVYRPTNFWTANRTSIVTAIQGLIQTGQVQLSFSADFIVTQQTNVALVASNLYASIIALNLASNVAGTNITAATNTLYSGVLAQITSATNTLYGSLTNYIGVSTNRIETNVLARLTTATNTVSTNMLAAITNSLTTMSNILSTYNSNILGGFTIEGISLTYNGGGLITNVAHSLGAAPRFLSCVLVCRTNDWGYVVGDRVDITGVQSDSGVRALVLGCNATNIFLVQYADTSIKIPNKSNGSKSTEIDRPSWTATIYAGQ